MDRYASLECLIQVEIMGNYFSSPSYRQRLEQHPSRSASSQVETNMLG
uniref:Uncharacterized protein n=1 Tax=Picea glauca TaxID=3330 RepID=A0A101LZL8_PICGL|nr:hypothetical protein ABT39_MTgene5281 [Picea glauca]